MLCKFVDLADHSMIQMDRFCNYHCYYAKKQFQHHRLNILLCHIACNPMHYRAMMHVCHYHQGISPLHKFCKIAGLFDLHTCRMYNLNSSLQLCVCLQLYHHPVNIYQLHTIYNLLHHHAKIGPILHRLNISQSHR